MKSEHSGSKRYSCLRSAKFFLACLITLFFVSIGSLSQAQDANPAYKQLRTVVPVDLSPSKPTSLPGTSGPQFGGGVEAVPISSALVRNWLPVIPNLQFGFNYLFGRNLSQTWWSADYVLPVSLTSSDIVFGEAHVDSASSASTGGFPFLNNFWQQGPAGLQNRIDLSFGLGYRKLFGDNLLVGAYGFYDSTRLTGSWRSARSVGFQAAANGPGDSAVDLNFNYYSDSYVGYDSRGSVFPTFNLFGAIASGTGNYDFEAGLSQPLFNRAYDFRVKAAGYKYEVGNSKVYGVRSGADVTTADGVFKVSAEYGNDRLVGQYGQIGAYVNIGFQAENIVKGENPFTKPEPIFKSPRHLRQLASQPAKRNWRKPSAVITNAKCEGLPDDSQFSSPANMACFFSGGAAGAKCTADGYTVIGDTPGGQWADAYSNQFPHPFVGSIYDYKRDIEPFFNCSSAAFARMASGTVHAYVISAYYPCKDTIFWKVELPILKSRGIEVLLFTNTGPGGAWVQVDVPDCGF
ncbi:MAG: hypothetical protein WC647_11885 [Desulfomonilaceae bacterium]|jgi:hypothetical protein